MSIEDYIGNTVFIELFGKGRYSGKTASQVGFVTKYFFEKYKDNLERYTPYFSELDGKHSEVSGSKEWRVIDSVQTLRNCLSAAVEADDYWMVYDEMFDGVESEELNKQVDLHQELISKFRIEETITYYFDEKEI